MTFSPGSHFSPAPRRRRLISLSPARTAGQPTTSLLRRKFDDHRLYSAEAGDSTPAKGRDGFRRRIGDVSARKLAAGMWQLHLTEVYGGKESRSVKYGSRDRLGIKLELPGQYPKANMEGVTKWDSMYSKTFKSVPHFHSQVKLPENSQDSAVSDVLMLQTGLAQAHKHIHELEAKHRSIKKNVIYSLRKLGEAKASCKSREQQKIDVVIDELRNELDRQRRNGKKLEILCFKLVNELINIKVSAKKYMQYYMEEKRQRQLIEQVCDEIAKKIGEGKAEIETLKMESVKVHEEVEEERRMLQLADAWREERVQMKLVDAKCVLEDKYLQMNILLTDLEDFLELRSATLDVNELRKAELIREEVKSVNIHDIKEFHYMPPEPYDIVSNFKEIQEDGSHQEIKPCVDYSPSCDSKIHSIIPDHELNGEHENEDSSANHNVGDTNVITNRTDLDENAGKLQSDMTGVSSVSEKQSKKDLFSVSKLLSLCTSSNMGPGKVLKQHKTIGKWSSRDSGNSHIVHGMKGCIKWPQSIQKNTLKPKLLETRMQNQKTQSHNVLQQNI